MSARRTVTELLPVAESSRLRELPTLLASLPHLTPEDLDAFEADLAEARGDLDHAQVPDPWES